MRYLGEVVCTRLEDGQVRVDRADPAVHISLDLLKGMYDAPSGVTFDEERGCLTIGDINPVTYALGDVVGEDYIEAVRVP
jgi:hypothetical protein